MGLIERSVWPYDLECLEWHLGNRRCDPLFEYLYLMVTRGETWWS